MRLNRGMSEGQGSSSRVGSRALWRMGVACLLVAGACHSQPPQPSAPSTGKVVDLNGDTPRDGPTTVHVDNQNLADMTIYLYLGGQRTRLGRARGNGVTELVIPKSILSGVTQVRFQAQPLGNSRGYTSELLPVTPGDIVDFFVPQY
ncbi:MAG: hypothetical protein JWL95_1257 [Gemmatimonadetes bacterium]|nr:hypothetical protein [Gemmatimonadota bacterium]